MASRIDVLQPLLHRNSSFAHGFTDGVICVLTPQGLRLLPFPSHVDDVLVPGRGGALHPSSGSDTLRTELSKQFLAVKLLRLFVDVVRLRAASVFNGLLERNLNNPCLT